MTKSIVINKQHLSVKSYKGQNVVTLKEIDLVHNRPGGTAKRNFQSNRERFIEGVDYFRVSADEIRTNKIMDISPKAHSDIALITESGYLMLAKSFTDDLAWSVQRQLVNFYFRANQSKPASLLTSEQLTLETAEYHYFDKTYKGQPVLTTKDIEYFTGISIGVLNYHLRGDYFIHGKDYFRLEGSVLKDFKAENPNVKRTVNSPYNIVTKAGFIRLLKQAGRTVEMPKCFEEVKKNETDDYMLEIQNFNKSDYITAINVLRAVIYCSKGSQQEYDGKKDPLNMLETYQKDINACTLSIKRICSFLSAGYGTDF